jgi:phospholipid/cholesterol/gamma-HCH transport system ATP-binding protein
VARMTAVPKIRLSGVKKRFGEKVVLDGVDLEVGAGESVIIIGGSGTGKSVTLKCILGLLEPEAGTIEVDGEDVTKLSHRERERANAKIGMLFQGAALFDSLRVWENVAFGLIEGKGLARDPAKEAALKALAQVGLTADVGEMEPADLSGGMRKRVGLARAICAKPEILFFDEPTTGLDPIMGDVINELIVKTVRDMGATTITITHDMASARKIGHRIAMLHQGKIVWTGPVANIDNSGNDFVDQFIHGRAEGPIRMAVRA